MSSHGELLSRELLSRELLSRELLSRELLSRELLSHSTARPTKKPPKAKEDKKYKTKPRTTIRSYDASAYPRRTKTLHFTIPIWEPEALIVPLPPPSIAPPRTALPRISPPRIVPPRAATPQAGSPRIASPKIECLLKKPETCVRDQQESSRDIFRHPRLPSSSSSTPRSSSFNSVQSTSSHSSSSSFPSISARDFANIKASIQTLEIEISRSAAAKCPVCEEPVDREFLQGFDGGVGGHLTVRRQMQFCEAHRVLTAKAQWKAKGYPNIDWEGFDRRLVHFHEALGDILHRTRPSYYRKAFEDHLKSGNRTLLQSMRSGSRMEEFELGYYGPRGALLMNEHIITHFASQIRHLAASDPLIHSNGVPAFVQAVLAPELALMLVMQDFPSTDAEDARRVLGESVEVGMLLNDEKDEVIGDHPSGRKGAERRSGQRLEEEEEEVCTRLTNGEDEDTRDRPSMGLGRREPEIDRTQQTVRESDDVSMLFRDEEDEAIQVRPSIYPGEGRRGVAERPPRVSKEDRDRAYRSQSHPHPLSHRRETQSQPRPKVARSDDLDMDELAV